MARATLVIPKVNWPDSKVIVDELPEVCKVKLVLASISDVSNDMLDRFFR